MVGRATGVAREHAAGKGPAARKTPESAAVAAVLAEALPSLDLSTTNTRLNDGYAIDSDLAQVKLTLAGFLRLVELTAPAMKGPLQDADWRDLYAILVGALKERAYPQWVQEERDLGLLLSPDIFQVPEPSITVALPAWRANWSTRLAWENRLRARWEQLDGLQTSRSAAVAAAEQAALPILRDALIGLLATPNGEVDLSESLTAELLIDFKATSAW